MPVAAWAAGCSGDNMTTNQQPLDLERLQELYDAATPGFWHNHPDQYGHLSPCAKAEIHYLLPKSAVDSDFITESHNAFPQLLAAAGRAVSMIGGEPMVCEQHPWLLWPDNDTECSGPGMPLSGAEGYHAETIAQARLREIDVSNLETNLAEALAMLKRLEISGEWEGSHEGRELAALIKRLEGK